MKKSIFLMVIFLCNFTGHVQCCPESCYCHGTRASCINKGMTYIPKFPGQIRTLNFSRNQLQTISQHTFTNLTNLYLSKLYLRDCGISKIKENSFSFLVHLTVLDLSKNRVAQVDHSFAFANLDLKLLRRLYLKYMNIQHTNKLFDSWTGSHLQSLYLEGNSINVLNGSHFKELKFLTILNLNKNKINSANFNGLHHIESLVLSQNRLTFVPKFCYEGKIFKHCIHISLAGNRIYEFNLTDFLGSCFPALQRLEIGLNAPSLLPNNIVSTLPSLKHFDVRWMNNKRFIFEPFAFNSTSLQALYISNHIAPFFKRVDFHNLFKLCPNLKILEMVKIPLLTYYANKDALQVLLSPLTKLEQLYLSNAEIWHLPDDVFSNMTNLKVLNLAYNFLSYLSNGVFRNLQKLKVLILKSNNIMLVNETSFPDFLLKNLDRLDLSGNHFSCTCNAFWFRNYIKTHNISLLFKYPHSYKCATPKSMSNKLFSSFDPTYRECHPLSPFIITAISVGSGLVVLLIVLPIIYHLRWHIKYYIYLLRTRKEYKKLPGDDEEYVYDAFVAYNAEDKIWVISKLIPRLEKTENFKLCLHDRDFVIGKLIVDNICDESQKSRKCIIVLSNNFAKSHWCQLELTLAQARHLRENNNHLIVVLLEDIQNKYMTNALRILLTSITYIEWQTDDKENGMFWDRLINALHK